MKGLKATIRKLHLFFGLLSGTVIFIVAVTGSLYCFEEELRSIVYKDMLTVKLEKSSTIPLDSIVGVVTSQYPKKPIKNIRIKEESFASVEVILKNKESVYVDPYTGEVLGSANKDNDFFGTVLKIHRTLYLGEAGKTVTGISALIFVGMLISGIVLWWPKGKKNTKNKFSVIKNARGARLTYDLHSVLGFYASWIIIFTALTGLIWSFKWAENSMYWITNSKKENIRPLHSEFSTAELSGYSLDQIVQKAKEISPSAGDYFINLPQDSAGVVKVTLQYKKAGFFRKTDQLYFDQYSGELMKKNLYKDTSKGERMKATNYNIHTGKVFGFLGQLLVFFAALITASLPVTGFIMWRRKKLSIR